jgi:hypothetical protein
MSDLLKASRALQRLGLSSLLSQESVFANLRFMVTSANHDFDKGPGERTLDVVAYVALRAELEALLVLFGEVPVEVERTRHGAGTSTSTPDSGSKEWAGCWCKGDIVFARYSK